MTIILLIVWALAGTDPALAEPWSGWFVALLICALADAT